MQNTETKRRCSILKKRRSRSLSPKPLADIKPRRSRRISFSGKNAVREFRFDENKETIWVASYEESTENHQFNAHQAIASSTMHSSTKNDTISIEMDMECSNISFQQQTTIQPPKQSFIPRPSVVRKEHVPMKIQSNPPSVGNSKLSGISIFKNLHQSAPVPKVFQSTVVEMETSHVALESQSSRRTIVQSQAISTENSLDDINIDRDGSRSKKTKMSAPSVRTTVFDAKDMSMDLNQSDTGSFDMNKTNQNTADMSVFMNCQPQVRDTVITKSPKKNYLEKTIVFNSDIEFTDVPSKNQNVSYHPIQLFENRKTSKEPVSIRENISIAKSSTEPLNGTICDEMEMDEFIIQKSDVVNPNIFSQLDRTQNDKRIETTTELCPQVKKPWIDPLPILTDADKENDPRIIDLMNNSSIQGNRSIDDTLKSESAIIENVFEVKHTRRTQYEQQSLEISNVSIEQQEPKKRNYLNETPFVAIPAVRKESLELNETIDMDDTLIKGIDLQTAPSQSQAKKSRNTIHFNASNVSANISIDNIEPSAASTSRIPLVSALNNMSLNIDNTEKPNDSMPKPTQNLLLDRINRTTTFANQSLDLSENSLEEPMTRSKKKFNPNKTPFTFKNDKESDMEMSTVSNSSIIVLDNTLRKQGIQLIPDNTYELKLQRRTELFNDTINSSQSDIMTSKTINNSAAIEISDTSIMNTSIEQAIKRPNRETCYQHLSMVQDDETNRQSSVHDGNVTKSVQKTIILDDNSFFAEPPKFDRKTRKTVHKIESMIMDESTLDETNMKLDSCNYLTDIGDHDTPSEKTNSKFLLPADTSLEPSKLSFYEDDNDDDDDDDDLGKTKPELIDSYESTAMDDVILRDCATNSKHSFGFNPIEVHPNQIEISDHEIPNLPTEVLNLDEHEIFKKSTLLRRSGVYEMPPNVNDETNPPEENCTNDAIETSVIVENEHGIFKKSTLMQRDEVPEIPEIDSIKTTNVARDDQRPSTSKQEPNRPFISRPSIIRRSIPSDAALDETSFLMNMNDDIPAKELKLDFSGYKKFEGLASIEDVFHNHELRRNEMARRIDRWTQQLNNDLPMEGIDNEEGQDNDDDEIETQNVEAPSWAFLWRNKLKCELEQIKLEIQHQYDERSPGAFLPVIPDISILILNKCKQLKNWKFDELWYFKGNIRLRSVILPAFSIIIMYDSNTEAIQRNVDLYGSLKFVKISTEFCPRMASVQCPYLHLKMRELKTSLPRDLTLLCDNSSTLSVFDERLNGIVNAAINKVDHLKSICDENHAHLKMEDGAVYIRKSMFCRRIREFQDYIIELNGIDTTNWQDVRTKPQRLLNEDVQKIPKGMQFIKEFLANDKKYVPILPSN